ncbi:protein kinase domain-containing protein [Streptomyces sp. NBC_01808]|uniref:serine/threonine-protein kinase n=1 Tax=Streptomyces sp. NBC_01808 TaxID=2975947 RepID=UPI003FA3AB4D
MQTGERMAGRYELVRRIGRGGMGEVWAGRDHDLHRDVALKLLVLDDDPSGDLPARFAREAVAAAQISHPNVVALHDRGVHEGVLFLVMEQVDGPSLSKVIQQEGPLETGRALELADGICAALAAAHAVGVIHNDIKPHNVMLTSEGRVKVVDFGIAGFLQTAFSLVRSTHLAPAGTPEYAAPEQFDAERGGRTFRSVRSRGRVVRDADRPAAVHRPQRARRDGTQDRRGRPASRRGTPWPAPGVGRSGRTAPGTRSGTAPALCCRSPGAAGPVERCRSPFPGWRRRGDRSTRTPATATRPRRAARPPHRGPRGAAPRPVAHHSRRRGHRPRGGR